MDAGDAVCGNRSSYLICIRELALGAHALLGDQQHSRADDQNRAEDIEDGGADAAGGGKLCTRLVLNVGRNNTGGNHSGELITATEGYQRGVIGRHIVSSRNGELDIGNCIVARGRGGLDQLVVAIIQATPGKSGHVLTLKLGPYSFICTRSVLLIQGEACALQRDEFLVAVAVGASFFSILGRIIGGFLVTLLTMVW